MKSWKPTGILLHTGHDPRFKIRPSTCQKMTKTVGPHHISQIMTCGIKHWNPSYHLKLSTYKRIFYIKGAEGGVLERRQKRKQERKHSLTPHYHPLHHFPLLLSYRRIWKVAETWRRNWSQRRRAANFGYLYPFSSLISFLYCLTIQICYGFHFNVHLCFYFFSSSTWAKLL